MGDTGIRRSVVAALTAQYPGIYTDENIALVSTHQHSGVGGYLEDLLPQVNSKHKFHPLVLTSLRRSPHWDMSSKVQTRS